MWKLLVPPIVATQAAELGCTGRWSTRVFQKLSAGNAGHGPIVGAARTLVAPRRAGRMAERTAGRIRMGAVFGLRLPRSMAVRRMSRGGDATSHSRQEAAVIFGRTEEAADQGL